MRASKGLPCFAKSFWVFYLEIGVKGIKIIPKIYLEIVIFLLSGLVIFLEIALRFQNTIVHSLWATKILEQNDFSLLYNKTMSYGFLLIFSTVSFS